MTKTIGSKKFKQLQEKFKEAGFYDELSQSYDALRTRIVDQKSKLNLTRLAKELNLNYTKLRLQVNKGPRMEQSWFDQFESKLKEKLKTK